MSHAAAPDSRYRSVVETMSEAVVVQGADGTTELCNARALELFGVTDAELRESFSVRGGLKAVRLDGSPYEPHDLPVNVTLRTGEPIRHVVMGITRRDGVRLWISVNTSAIHEDGRVRAVVCTFNDVTHRSELETQLRQAQKMEAVGQLAGGIAHDFNNILTAISCNVELLLDAIAPTDARRDDVVQIREAADRAASLTRQLLAFSRRQVLQPRSLDLNDTVAGMERLLCRVISADVRLRTQLEAGLPSVFADAGQMEQVMLNLVLNSRDAMPAGGTIVVRTARLSLSAPHQHRLGAVPAGDYVTLSVKDAGAGMTADVMARLFEPFFTTKPLGRGTGLGLATVHGIVSQSSGHVTVESEPGAGAEFTVYLPALQAAIPSAPQVPARGPSRHIGRTVLVVDDEAAVRDVTMRAVSRAGYRVLGAGSGEQAIQLLANEADPHTVLLLTDIMMPGMSGHELATWVAEHFPAVRVAAMSGFSADELAHRGHLPLPQLHKPFTLPQLLAFVNDAFGEARAVA
jgi:two-component system cell cycle sensor histidine kinase/response regulator CckA